MKLSGLHLQQLQQALVSAYPTPNSLAQMVRIRLDENLHTVAGSGDLSELVFNLIRWAEAGGRLTALVEGAHAANSGNPALDAFVTEVWQGLVSPSPAQRTSTPDATLRKPPSYPPFIVGSPVPPGQMVDRQIALRRVVGRILNEGQSTAVVGEPRLGKSSLLHFISSAERRHELFGSMNERLLFARLNGQALGAHCTPALFWEQALAPVKSYLVDPAADSPLAQHYQRGLAAGFAAFALEGLLRQVVASHQRLVLLIDEFDSLLYHPLLNHADFFGGLRTVITQNRGALALVVASRLPLTRLNAETHHFNPTGSPYFNFLAEVVLGGLDERDSEAILAPASMRFSDEDRHFLRHLAGGHPYLLQAAGAALWEAYDLDLSESRARHHYVFDHLYREHTHQFADTWRVWRAETRQAFVCVALAHAQTLLADHPFDIRLLLDHLPNLEPELNDLAHAGLVARQPTANGGWQVEQRIMLAWLLREITPSLRSAATFDQWLRASELHDRWNQTQRSQLRAAIQTLAPRTTLLRDRLVRTVGQSVSAPSLVTP
jgi:hypothetical protein